MPDLDKEEVAKLLEKYKHKLDKELDSKEDFIQQEAIKKTVVTEDYEQFKRENLPSHMSVYENLCNFSEKIAKIAPPKSKVEQIQKSIETCHFNITPYGVMSFAILFPLCFLIIGSTISYVLPILLGGEPNLFFISFFMLSGILMMIPLTTIPNLFANSWRMRASNQMVLCVFYIVTYMRHTSNLENALQFAAEHISPPLSLDLKKVLWDVETEKYENLKESLDDYLERWRDYNMEFVEAMHLIESSLFEGDDNRRLAMLDKALDVILQETYEKMLRFARDLKSPITILNMIGIILPVLILVILPLIVAFLESVKWYHIAVLFNIILPVTLYYFSLDILSKRPTGYGDTDITELNPELKRYDYVYIKIGKSEKKVNPIYISMMIIILFVLVGLSPLLIHLSNPDFDVPLGKNFKLLEYRESVKEKYTDEFGTEHPVIKGPFGLGATLLSIFVVMGVGVGIGLYYQMRSKDIMKIKEETDKLENEFASALFQLSNRLSDGIPAELAFVKVADIMEGTNSAKMFRIIDTNIRRLGMSVYEAIFNEKMGAIIYYPSNIIQSSMKVLIQSVTKGPLIAAQAVANVSRYIKEIHQVNERLEDLMADVISSMKSQVSFLAPTISGIVIGITSMITTIIGKLVTSTQSIAAKTEMNQAQGMMDMFGDGLPTYYFQIVVGLYVIQVIFILSILISGIQNGTDKLSRRSILGKNLVFGTMLYCIIASVVIIIFNMIAGQVLGKGFS